MWEAFDQPRMIAGAPAHKRRFTINLSFLLPSCVSGSFLPGLGSRAPPAPHTQFDQVIEAIAQSVSSPGAEFPRFERNTELAQIAQLVEHLLLRGHAARQRPGDLTVAEGQPRERRCGVAYRM